MLEHKAENMSKEQRGLNFCSCGQRLVLFLGDIAGEETLFFSCDACNSGHGVHVAARLSKHLKQVIETNTKE